MRRDLKGHLGSRVQKLAVRKAMNVQKFIYKLCVWGCVCFKFIIMRSHQFTRDL